MTHVQRAIKRRKERENGRRQKKGIHRFKKLESPIETILSKARSSNALKAKAREDAKKVNKEGIKSGRQWVQEK